MAFDVSEDAITPIFSNFVKLLLEKFIEIHGYNSSSSITFLSSAQPHKIPSRNGRVRNKCSIAPSIANANNKLAPTASGEPAGASIARPPTHNAPTQISAMDTNSAGLSLFGP